MGLAIYDAKGVKRFEKMYGTFAPDQRVAIASSSKMVAGLVILRLVDQGFLTLDSTTGAVLGWTGPQGAITLRQLLSFTSGLDARSAVHFVSGHHAGGLRGDRFRSRRWWRAPGTRFDYGSTHLHVAARMAEVVTGADVGEPLCDAIEDAAGAHVAGPGVVHGAAPGGGHYRIR